MVRNPTPTTASPPTLWGLTPTQLHDRFWASRGVYVVRQGEGDEVPRSAEQYLLTEAGIFALFRLRGLIDVLSWVQPDILLVRLQGSAEQSYRETAVSDDAGQFVEFRRTYDGVRSGVARVVLTRDHQLAEVWRSAPDARTAWRELRRLTRHRKREAGSVRGRAYDRLDDESTARFVRELIQLWRAPATTVGDVRRAAPGVWAHRGARVDATTRFIGSVWVGAGRVLEGQRSVIGPAALWDDPTARPAASRIAWDSIESAGPDPGPVRVRRESPWYDRAKRAFDLLFALLALLLTAPLYPLVMAAIWLEDGAPFFFTHRRETIGGREFPCIKFRSMRKNAEQLKVQLAAANQADGPQFYMASDPRLTRVGRLLRRTNIDELPQFINVLLGDMSVVGPRPSPRKENQYCPPWREARLSVRPGITGLWQVKRTRRQGMDFQEWIKYDIEYVENASWWLDLTIVVRTLVVLLRGVVRA